MEQLDSQSYEFHGLWKHPILTNYFWTVIFVPELARELDLPIAEMGTIKMNEGEFLVKREITQALERHLISRIQLGDEEYFKSFKSIFEREFRSVREHIQSIAAQEPTSESVRNLTNQLIRISFLECIGYLFTYSIEDSLKAEGVLHGISADQLNDYIPVIETPLLSHAGKLRDLKKLLEDRNLLHRSESELIEAIQNTPELSHAFEAHLAQFRWVEIVAFLGQELTLNSLLLAVLHVEPEYSGNLEPKPAPAGMETWVVASSYISNMRQIGAEYFSMCMEITRPFFRTSAEKLGISYEELCLLTPPEIAQLIEGGDYEATKALCARRARKKWVLYQPTNLEMCLIEDLHEVAQLERALLPVDTSKNLTGQIGCKGITQGKVKVILNGEDFYKMEKGDVLVTTMTTPDFVTLMHMACAIVTDIGGLLSHAAIISREMQKPCVIGTKRATQILKDGDLVEVNADTGTITLVA